MLHFDTSTSVIPIGCCRCDSSTGFGRELQAQTWHFQIAGTAALFGLVSGASHHDTVCPCYVTLLPSAALILEFSIKSDIVVGDLLCQEVFCICQGPLRTWHLYSAADRESYWHLSNPGLCDGASPLARWTCSLSGCLISSGPFLLKITGTDRAEA